MVHSPSSSSFCLYFSLRPSPVSGFVWLNIISIILLMCMTQNSHEGCDRTRGHTDQFISAFWANSLSIFRLMNNFTAWIKEIYSDKDIKYTDFTQWLRDHQINQTAQRLTYWKPRLAVAGPFWLWVLTHFLLWIISGNTFHCPLMIYIPKGLGWIRLSLINTTYQETAHCQLTCAN